MKHGELSKKSRSNFLLTVCSRHSLKDIKENLQYSLTCKFDSLFLIILTLSCIFQEVNAEYIWEILHMDDTNDCNREIVNKNMEKGDKYILRSDRTKGSPQSKEKPAECVYYFNFQERTVDINLIDWHCKSRSRKPYLAVYNDCLKKRSPSNLLAWFNCSTKSPVFKASGGTCLTIYHYRGLVNEGYFYELQVLASNEKVSYEVPIYVGISVAIFVGVLFIIKCCIVLYKCFKHKRSRRRRQDDKDEGVFHRNCSNMMRYISSYEDAEVI